MNERRVSNVLSLACVMYVSAHLSGCGVNQARTTSIVPAESTQAAAGRTDARSTDGAVASASTPAPVTHRSGFLGAFFRPVGSPPFGVFEPQSSDVQPEPYPTPGTTLIGPSGYCDQIGTNGTSIDRSYRVDTTKLNDAIYLGARWTRMPASQFNDDGSHTFGPGIYRFTDLDAAQCISFVYHGLRPIIGLEAGPVQYDAVAGKFSPVTVPQYKTARDFGQWCGVVAAHEKAVFGISQFSLPGNEVNSDPSLFPGGEAQIATYSEACYAAIKAANPSAFVYGFELNMDGNLNAPAFVGRMYGLGCKVGTCYDGIAMHLTLRYPIPPAGTPCYPHVGGDYSVQCISDVQAAAQAPIHVLISETAYSVPAGVPDERTKALAVVADVTAFAAIPSVDGVNYANIDECALYPAGYWSDGCLIDVAGNALPAYAALQYLAALNFN
jgi:hypothetical protein